MAQIKNEIAYRAALARIEELLPLVNEETPADDRNYLELDMLSDMVEEYEDIYYPIGKPTLIDVIKLRLYEMGITQKKDSPRALSREILPSVSPLLYYFFLSRAIGLTLLPGLYLVGDLSHVQF